MSRKHDSRGRRTTGPAYVQLFHWIRSTEAWRSLAPYSRLLYVEIRGRFNGSNNGDIPMSYREAAELIGCTNRPVIIAFRELQDRGFIRPVQKGAFDWKVRAGGKGRATTWLLTELPQDVPTRDISPSYDFKGWTTPTSKNKTRRANSTPLACEMHPIDPAMACEMHPNEVRNARHERPNQPSDGVQNARTSNLPYTPTPTGAVSQALLNTRLMQRAAAPLRRSTEQASGGGRS